MKTSQQDQRVELIGQVLGGRCSGEAKRQLGDGTGHCFGPCREGPAPKYGLQFSQTWVELELLPAASKPSASCQLKHVLLADEIQIPELYETLSHRQSQATILFLTLPEQVCFPISQREILSEIWIKLRLYYGTWEKQVVVVGSQMDLGEAKGRSYTSSPTCMGKDHR